MLKKPLQPLAAKLWENPFIRFTAPEAMARMVRHGFPVGTVLDIGASDGSWSLRTMARFPQAHFFAIEPLAERRPALEQVKAAQKNFDFVIAAAGRSSGEVHLNVTADLDGSTVDGGDGEARSVPSLTLDRIVADHSLRGPFLIKFDTHGFEDDILAGATETLRAASVIIMEVYNFDISPHALRFPAMCARLEALGFRCYDMADPLLRQRDGALWQMDLYFCRADHGMFRHAGFR